MSVLSIPAFPVPQLLAGPGESCVRVHNEQIDGVNGGRGRKRGRRKREGRKKEEKKERLIEGMKYTLSFCNHLCFIFTLIPVVCHFYSKEAIVLAVIIVTYLA